MRRVIAQFQASIPFWQCPAAGGRMACPTCAGVGQSYLSTIHLETGFLKEPQHQYNPSGTAATRLNPAAATAPPPWRRVLTAHLFESCTVRSALEWSMYSVTAENRSFGPDTPSPTLPELCFRQPLGTIMLSPQAQLTSRLQPSALQHLRQPQRQRQRQRHRPGVRTAATTAAGKVHDTELLAQQRAELGGHLVRHLAGLAPVRTQ